MAKNWSAAEAVKVVREGKDKAAIRDIGGRFPLFIFLAASNPVGIIEALPEYVSARKIEAILKGDIDTSASSASDDDDEEEEEEVKPVKKSKKKAAAKETPKSKKKAKAAEEDDDDDDEDWDI